MHVFGRLKPDRIYIVTQRTYVKGRAVPRAWVAAGAGRRGPQGPSWASTMRPDPSLTETSGKKDNSSLNAQTYRKCNFPITPTVRLLLFLVMLWWWYLL